ncbi:MAG: 16S rRNA (adenine(1518)-N(6)/adenine(1519)-N(6))-dimethyltransferase [Micavibrio aeruginosavorus]|uniref:Ribosomal RNA small subunit methyltransferase A n=1 Tax=Micavibrio aeruginosavorus TaxID=349221 RepID=A0A2W5FLB8_9BACT|nr:MAG: 16S rRNA (adenine(1518)-N(6)/adenine(1519)-N(6))-dimethyltransferase [Micavibrio aeruginosavorus]
MSEPASDYDALQSLPPLRDVIRDHNLRAEKALGQNFLLDLNVTDKIARSAESMGGALKDVTVFEIGPGPGGLTRSLLGTEAKKIIAIEFDDRAVAALADVVKVAKGRLDVIKADALHANLIAMADGARAIIANLPYNISTVLLLKWLRDLRQDPEHYKFMALMFQKEVADRLVAKPHTKEYGRLSVMVQWLCTIGKAFDLPPEAFSPPPKVTSSIVVFRPKILPADAPAFETLEKILSIGFQQRRKMIRTSLKIYMAEIEMLGIDPTLRTENLTVDDYVRIAQAVERRQQ